MKVYFEVFYERTSKYYVGHNTRSLTVNICNSFDMFEVTIPKMKVTERLKILKESW